MDDASDVMSLDELMDLAAESPTRQMARPAPPPMEPTVAQPTIRISRPEPTPREHEPARTEPGQAAMLAARLQADGRQILVEARRASATGFSLSREWLGTADNALIAATVLVTLLLLIVVAAL